MCLFDPKQITTDKDIVCYKILKKINDDTYVSPYYGGKSKKWILNKTKKIKTKTINIHDEYIIKYIEENVLHSLKTIMDAMHYSNDIICAVPNYNDYFLFKCVIPKSSKNIFEGYCSGNLYNPNGYASTELKPIEIICPIDEIQFSKEIINFVKQNKTQ